MIATAAEACETVGETNWSDAAVYIALIAMVAICVWRWTR